MAATRTDHHRAPATEPRRHKALTAREAQAAVQDTVQLATELHGLPNPKPLDCYWRIGRCVLQLGLGRCWLLAADELSADDRDVVAKRHLDRWMNKSWLPVPTAPSTATESECASAVHLLAGYREVLSELASAVGKGDPQVYARLREHVERLVNEH